MIDKKENKLKLEVGVESQDLGGELKPTIDLSYIKDTDNLDLQINLNVDEDIELKVTLKKEW